MKQTIKYLFAALVSVIVAVSAFAQVTTSSLSGHVYDSVGNVEGAAVVAIHAPSGTQYHAVSDKSGNYRIHNMRVGGPYVVTVELLGFGKAKASGIMLKLGETYVWDVELKEEAIALDGVVFSAEAENTILTSEKVGTSTNFTRRELTNLPTGSRTINDMVKLTPQSNGMSFGGRDNRYNNFSVDGAGFNNNFGLSSDLPGGDSGPISYDAIEEISVSIAPYDVRQSRFTGAAINAVTKSGTNDFDGSVYTYQKFRGMNGTMVGNEVVKGADELSSQTYGLSIGGPIIKNKLFFFVNAEYSPTVSPGPSWVPSTDGVGDAKKGISRTTFEDLELVRNYLIENYDYDPGSYGKGGWDSFNDYNYKILARIDWNINADHKLMLRYNDVKNSVMNLTNNNSCPPGLPRDKNVKRVGPQSIAFSKNFYRMDNNVRSIVAELNSRFSDVVSNNLLVSYNMISDTRDPQSELFPHVDIYKDGTQYMSLGLELFSFNNAVINNTATITDNVTINLNRHTLTAGASFEYMFVKNSYIREGTAYYRYDSVEDFINDRTPIGMGITYGFNGEEAPGQKLNYGQLSAYIQDEWEVSRRFKLTYGVRFELPMYLDKDMMKNNVIYDIANTNKFAGGPWDTSTWPKSHLSVNPRIGFNWDVLGDRSLQLRGGTGLFTGVNPFVWFTNQAGSAAFVQSPEISISDFTNYPGMKFYPDYKDLLAAYPSQFPTKPDPNYLANEATICLVDKNFKFPQVWRSNLAIDVKLPWNMVFTAEALVSRDVVGVKQVNLNEPAPTGKMFGADNRSVWDASKVVTTVGKYKTPAVTSDLTAAMLFTNTQKKGYSAQVTAQLTKNFSYGLSGSVAYTYSHVRDLTDNPGSAAYSAWTSSSAVNSLNEEVLSYSNFSTPHRVIANLSYRLEYARNFATTFSIFYQGAHRGRISYIYNGDVNGDGQSSDLMYIPKDASEIEFVDLKYKDKSTGTETFLATAEDQEKAFFEYVDNDKYLKAHRGKYVERFGGLQKWVNMIDFKVLQDLWTNFGSNNRYSLQLSLDILNVGNLLNNSWGCYYTSPSLNYSNQSLLSVVSKGTETAAPTFTLNVGSADKVAKDQGVAAFKKNAEWNRALEANNCWSMLLGIRLTF